MNNEFSSLKKTQGFSLVEVLVAALIVAVGIIGLARLQGITLSNSSESRARTDALNLAQEKIEELRTFSNQSAYDMMASGTNANTDPDMAGGNANFTRNWTVTDCTNSMNCKQVNVSVNWTDSSGVVQTVRLTSFITQVDPVQAGIVLANAIPQGTGRAATNEAIAKDKIIQTSGYYSSAQKAASRVAKDAAVAAAGLGNNELAEEKLVEVKEIYNNPGSY
jgi:type IV pilus modification protein PilV